MHFRALIRLLAVLVIGALPPLHAQPANVAAMRVSEPLQFRIVRTIPHDPARFTQGLAWHDGTLFESTGRYGESALFALNPATGATLRARSLTREVFAEGLARVRDTLVQLTWRERRAFRYGEDLAPRGEWRYDGEGWGLTHDGKAFVMSDGSSELQFRSDQDFRLLRRLPVRDGREPIGLLNELEYAHGLVLANVWMDDRIAVIDPASGSVRAWLELGALTRGFARPPGFDPDEHVLNGIAHDPQRDRYYVTGKCWPVIYELEIPALPRLLSLPTENATK